MLALRLLHDLMHSMCLYTKLMQCVLSVVLQANNVCLAIEDSSPNPIDTVTLNSKQFS